MSQSISKLEQTKYGRRKTEERVPQETGETEEVKPVFHFGNGEYDLVEVDGLGRCGLLCLLALFLLKGGTPMEVVRKAVHGGVLDPGMRCMAMELRRLIVELSRKNPVAGFDPHVAAWEKRVIGEHGWTDEKFLYLGAELLGLDFKIVTEDKDGRLVEYQYEYQWGKRVSESQHLILHNAQVGHFDLLVRKVRDRIKKLGVGR